MEKYKSVENLSQEEIDQFKDLIKDNSITSVSKILGISRKSVYNYMHRLGIEPNKMHMGGLSKALQNIKK